MPLKAYLGPISSLSFPVSSCLHPSFPHQIILIVFCLNLGKQWSQSRFSKAPKSTSQETSFLPWVIFSAILSRVGSCRLWKNSVWMRDKGIAELLWDKTCLSCCSSCHSSRFKYLYLQQILLGWGYISPVEYHLPSVHKALDSISRTLLIVLMDQ